MKPYDPNLSDAENLATDHTDESQNEGEGSRTAARRYNADVRAFVSQDHGASARQAANTIGTPTGAADLAAAEAAKHRPAPSLMERAKGLFNRVRHLIESRRKAHAAR